MRSSLVSISWFGSSGGGLPRRPELKSSGRFFYGFVLLRTRSRGDICLPSAKSKGSCWLCCYPIPLLRAPRAIPANLQSRYHNPEPAVFFHLSLQLLENIAHELHDLAATQARHVDVVPVQLALVVVSLAVDVHQVEFVNQSMPLQQPQRPVHRAAIHARIQFLRLA